MILVEGEVEVSDFWGGRGGGGGGLVKGCGFGSFGSFEF